MPKTPPQIPAPLSVTPDELLLIIGRQTVEIEMLKKALDAARAEKATAP